MANNRWRRIFDVQRKINQRRGIYVNRKWMLQLQKVYQVGKKLGIVNTSFEKFAWFVMSEETSQHHAKEMSLNNKHLDAFARKYLEVRNER